MDHSIIVEKLKPYKNYTFYVRVYNGKSGSDQSEKVTCKTQDGGVYCDIKNICENFNILFPFFKAPQTVPTLTVTPLSPVSLYVEWSAINVSLVGGVVTQYQVMWRKTHSTSNYVQLLHKNVRRYTITGNLNNYIILFTSITYMFIYFRS